MKMFYISNLDERLPEKEDITIVLKEGDYYLEKPIKLDRHYRKLTLKAEGKVRLIGGKRLEGVEKVKDKKILRRFDEKVRDKILQCDLTKNGVSKLIPFSARGFGRPITPSHTELFVDTIPYNISQYPKKGKYMPITGYLKEVINEWDQKVGSLEAGFKYDSERPKNWAPSTNIWVNGYWSWDWANTYERVAELDVNNMTVKTAPPYGHHAFKVGQRFYFLNILEEVTEPGDYYIDAQTKILFFYPRDNAKCEEVIISVMDEPLMEIDGADSIVIEGITFEAATSFGLRILNSDNIHIKNCYFRNIGNTAIDILNSKNVQIANCTIHDTGDSGINIVSGDRRTLTPANISVYNNHIYNIAKWVRCYQTPIKISGVGISATHNLIHDCPHTAILFSGNDITLGYNEIYNVVMETGDAGAIYTGRDYTFRGNRVCNNYIHHLGGVGMGTMGIYNDDCVSGTHMEGNVFHEVSRAVFLGGGRDLLVKNNVFIDCYPAIEIDGRGASNHKVWKNMVFNIMKNRFYQIGGDRSPFIEKYPELAVIDEFYKQDKPIPPQAVIQNNVYCSKRKLELKWDSEKGKILTESNFACGIDDFEDFKARDFRLKANSEAFNYGYVNVDFYKIGLVEEDRTVNPPKVISHLEIDRDTNTILLLLNNQSDKEVHGRMILYTNKHIENFSGTSIEIDLTAYEVKEYKVALPRIYEKVQIETRCDVAGVRPCRTEFDPEKNNTY
jgi:hypothetical protein